MRALADPGVTAPGLGVGDGVVQGRQGLLLRLEGGVLFGAALFGYAWCGAGWWMFAALFLVPDLAMLGYLRGPRIGAWCYNVAHVTIGPVILLIAAQTMGSPRGVAVGLVWLAHIGIDRLLGYGLKYSDRFKHTHLSA